MHGLFAVAGDDGSLECFDLRAKGSAGYLDAAARIGAPGGGGGKRAVGGSLGQLG